MILINRWSRKWSCTEFMKFFLFLLFFNNGRKNNFRNVTIFISYPMYFGALRTNINSKNQKSIIKWSFWAKIWAFPPIWRSLADLGEDDQFWGQNDHIMILFLFFELIFVLSAPKYIGYDIKIVIFRNLFFLTSFENN